jgi:hypothetical protein
LLQTPITSPPRLGAKLTVRVAGVAGEQTRTGEPVDQSVTQFSSGVFALAVWRTVIVAIAESLKNKMKKQKQRQCFIQRSDRTGPPDQASFRKKVVQKFSGSAQSVNEDAIINGSINTVNNMCKKISLAYSYALGANPGRVFFLLDLLC